MKNKTKNKVNKKKQLKTKKKKVRILNNKYTSQNTQVYLCIYYILHIS